MSTLEKKLGEYFRGKGARYAYLFGSLASGREGPESDCDLAVLMPDPWDTKRGLSLSAEWETELRKLCGRPVDLVFLNDATPLLFFEAIRVSRLLYSEDEIQRLQMEKRAHDAYEDYVYIQSFFVRALREKLAS